MTAKWIGSKSKIQDFKRRVNKDFLEPISGTIKRRKFAVIDIESKDGDSQIPGFTRPFLVGLFDPRNMEYQEFRDELHLYLPESGYTWDRRHIAPGGCIDKLMSVILSKKYAGNIFYAHNGGNFDYLFLLTWLQEHRQEFGFELVPIQSSIQIIRVWRIPEGPDDPIIEKWEFLDSMRLLPMGLDRACKTFGLPGKVSHDLAMHEADPRWGIYLKQDCVALATVMTLLYDMVEFKLGGEVGITAPSTAMKLFRRRFLGKDGTPDRLPRWGHWSDCKSKDTCDGCAHDWIRKGYYGGRTEIFRMQGSGLHYYDINSSYVAAMREEMPVGERSVEIGVLDWRKHRSEGGNYSGFCECTVFIPPNCEIPPLPHRSKDTGKLIFPTGQFHGVWSMEELALLKDTIVGGEIRHVTKTVWFRLKPVFSRMVDELWTLRDKTRDDFDEGLSALAKLLGNSSYGKFAMKQERTSVVFSQDVTKDLCFLCKKEVKDSPDYFTGPGSTSARLCTGCEGSKPAMLEPDGDVWYQANKVDAPYIIPHIAAHITALARVRLWSYMKEAIAMGGKLYYTDTDSIITDVELKSSSALGALKDEYPNEELNYLAVQPKVYMIERVRFNRDVSCRKALLYLALSGLPVGNEFDASTLDKDPIELEYKVTMKGFPPAIRNKRNLERLSAGETLEWDRLEKVRTLARTGFRRPPKMMHVTKAFRSKYDKRHAVGDNETKAIVLNEPIGGYDEVEEAAE